jgi:hypothetical protein
MSWWAWVLLGWLVLSLPVGVLVGRMIRLGQREDAEHQRGEAAGPTDTPGAARPPDAGEDRSA